MNIDIDKRTVLITGNKNIIQSIVSRLKSIQDFENKGTRLYITDTIYNVDLFCTTLCSIDYFYNNIDITIIEG